MAHELQLQFRLFTSLDLLYIELNNSNIFRNFKTWLVAYAFGPSAALRVLGMSSLLIKSVYLRHSVIMKLTPISLLVLFLYSIFELFCIAFLLLGMVFKNQIGIRGFK